ncbi:MAG: RsiV family protein [Candidatus Eisenbacteria bacterium]
MVEGLPPVLADPDSMLGARLAGFETVSPNQAPWFEQVVARVERFRPGLLTLSFYQAAYTGGAHANSSLLYLNVDPATARALPLDSLLVPGARDSLLAAAERGFRRARGMAADSSFALGGFWFRSARFELTPNYGLTGEGLVFHYNNYEVAPYVFGSTHAVVPWPELPGLVRPRYLRAPG